MHGSVGLCVLLVGVGLPSRTTFADGIDQELVSQFKAALADFDRGQELQAERPDRARELFRSAAQRFESIVAAGVVNGKLEYNLGNCYLQTQDVGRAILHYRRAERWIPRDPLLAGNLAEAKSRCLTTVPRTRRSALLHNLFFWHFETSMRDRWHAAIACYVMFWVLLGVRTIVTRHGSEPGVGRRTVNILTIASAALSITLGASLGVQRWVDQRAARGVITAMDVTVYKGPGVSYQRQFEQPLQAGVEFTLLEKRAGWWNIRLDDAKTGWVDANSAELIVTPHRAMRLGAARSSTPFNTSARNRRSVACARSLVTYTVRS
ncbi:MAG: hypothetical protein ACE5HE_02460 [Phycisphaerae bacterium]